MKREVSSEQSTVSSQCATPNRGSQLAAARWLLPALILLFSLHAPLPTLQAQPTHYAFGPTFGTIIATGGSPFNGRSPTAGIDVAALWQQTDTSVFWHRFWGYPFMGIRANYAHIWHSPAGHRFGLAGTLQGPLIGPLHWTYSVGLSAYTRPYSVTHDTANIFIGSHLNCLIDIGLLYNLPLSDRLALTAALKIVHSSNGYLYKPNHGLNYLQLDIALRYQAVSSQQPAVSTGRRPLTDPHFSPYGRPFILIAPAAVMSRYDPPDSIRFHPAYTLQLGYIRHPHPCFNYGAALDLSYNFSHSSQPTAPRLPVYPAATLFGDCLWGPLTLRVGLAHYLHRYPLNWSQYYERVALYYRLNPHHMVGVGMKVHDDHIDFVEWSYAFEL